MSKDMNELKKRISARKYTFPKNREVHPKFKELIKACFEEKEEDRID